MIRLLRTVGFTLIAAGLLLAASWFIEPLRGLWSVLLALPWPIRIGLAVAAIGLVVVFATVVHDRLTSNPNSTEEKLGDQS